MSCALKTKVFAEFQADRSNKRDRNWHLAFQKPIKVTNQKKIKHFHNTSKLVKRLEQANTVFCFNIFKIVYIWSNLFNYQQLNTISRFLNSGFQDESLVPKSLYFEEIIFFACIRELFNLKFHKNRLAISTCEQIVFSKKSHSNKTSSFSRKISKMSENNACISNYYL